MKAQLHKKRYSGIVTQARQLLAEGMPTIDVARSLIYESAKYSLSANRTIKLLEDCGLDPEPTLIALQQSS